MNRPPRDPKVPITNPPPWRGGILYGGRAFLARPRAARGRPGHAVSGRQAQRLDDDVLRRRRTRTIFSGLVMRREPTSGLTTPVLSAVKVLVIPVALIVLSTELAFMQKGLLARYLSGPSGSHASVLRWCCRWSSRSTVGAGAAGQAGRSRSTPRTPSPRRGPWRAPGASGRGRPATRLPSPLLGDKSPATAPVGHTC